MVLCLAATMPAAAVEFGPQGIVRQFCQFDGMGERLRPGGWWSVAPLVDWQLEPAWDQIMLIVGYTVDPPTAGPRGALDVDVVYSVVGVLTARGLNTEPRVDRVTYRVHAPDERGWHIMGPPPPPYVFGDRIDVAAVRRSLTNGTRTFVPNSAFVWHMFQDAGWSVGLERTFDLLTSGAYRPVDQPAAGDLVAYSRGSVPYHVGILDEHSQVISSTLNFGIVRTEITAFAGDVQYLRLVDPGGVRRPADGTTSVSQVSPLKSEVLRQKARPQRTPRRVSATPTRERDVAKPTPERTPAPLRMTPAATAPRLLP